MPRSDSMEGWRKQFPGGRDPEGAERDPEEPTGDPQTPSQSRHLTHH